MRDIEMNLNTAVICSAKKKSNHCKSVCPHGSPHEKDGCGTDELCSLSRSKKPIYVHCKKLTKKQIKGCKNAN